MKCFIRLTEKNILSVLQYGESHCELASSVPSLILSPGDITIEASYKGIVIRAVIWNESLR